MVRYTVIKELEQETRYKMNYHDMKNTTEAVIEIEKMRKTLDWFCNTYRVYVMNAMLKGERIEELANLLERINNAQNKESS